MTYADLYVAEFISRVQVLQPNALDEHPKSKDYCQKVHEIPAVAERVKNRPDFPY